MQDSPKTFSTQEIREIYYSILANGSKAHLLESIVTTKLFDLFNTPEPVSESTIIRNLHLHEQRAKKWLFELVQEGYLELKSNEEEPYYVLSSLSKQLHTNVDDTWTHCEQMVAAWRLSAHDDLSEVLKGGKTIVEVNWPPKTAEQAEQFESWLGMTSLPVIQSVINTINEIPKNFNKLLDLGCGDASITIALANHFKKMEFGAYNLPLSLKIAEAKIEQFNMKERIKTISGDFLKDDALPSDYECILLSRVLWNFSYDVTKKILKKSYDALPGEGYIIISEVFREQNPNFISILEYSTILWDSFEAGIYKTSDQYKKILREVGFKNAQLYTYPNNMFAVLIAHK